MAKKRVAIIGATGYTGSELVRILTYHPNVEIVAITSESRAGEAFSDVHPFYQGIVDHTLISSDRIDEYQPELVFLALPHGVAMDFVKKFKDRSFKIIDLSGDFRLPSAEMYEEWYQQQHHFPEGIAQAVFGLPELFIDDIKTARLVANPGCYPTSAILAIAPLLSHKHIEPQPIIVDSKSGVTGAGIKAKPVTHFPSVNENFKAYNLKRHRHSIEIQEILNRVAGLNTTIQFSPHLLPVDRGILSTIYMLPNGNTTEAILQDIYRDFYDAAPFVRIRRELPSIKDVRGTNYCDLYIAFDDRTGLIIAVSVIDNLVKGAAGQAVQNMNIMFGDDQTAGLYAAPVHP